MAESQLLAEEAMNKALLLMIGIAIGYALKTGVDAMGERSAAIDAADAPPGDPWAADDHLLEGEFDPEALAY